MRVCPADVRAAPAWRRLPAEMPSPGPQVHAVGPGQQLGGQHQALRGGGAGVDVHAELLHGLQGNVARVQAHEHQRGLAAGGVAHQVENKAPPIGFQRRMGAKTQARHRRQRGRPCQRHRAADGRESPDAKGTPPQIGAGSAAAQEVRTHADDHWCVLFQANIGLGAN